MGVNICQDVTDVKWDIIPQSATSTSTSGTGQNLQLIDVDEDFVACISVNESGAGVTAISAIVQSSTASDFASGNTTVVSAATIGLTADATSHAVVRVPIADVVGKYVRVVISHTLGSGGLEVAACFLFRRKTRTALATAAAAVS